MHEIISVCFLHFAGSLIIHCLVTREMLIRSPASTVRKASGVPSGLPPSKFYRLLWSSKWCCFPSSSLGFARCDLNRMAGKHTFHGNEVRVTVHPLSQKVCLEHKERNAEGIWTWQHIAKPGPEMLLLKPCVGEENHVMFHFGWGRFASRMKNVLIYTVQVCFSLFLRR